MKKVLYGLILAALMIGGVQANQNIRQNPDGTADWMSTNNQPNPAGAAYIQLVIGLANLNGATHFVVSPISDGKIVDARISRQGTALSGGRQLITFKVGNNATPMQLRSRELTGAALSLLNTNISDASINIGVSGNVTTYAITSPGAVTRGELINNTVERGSFITIFVTGANTVATTGHLILTIQPK
jgi:hypothetical protein